MAQFPLLGHGFPPEPVNHPLGGPRGLDVAGPTICPAPEEEPSRPEQVQASLDAPEHFMDEPKSTESATSPSKLPLASSHEHQDGGKPCEHSVSGLEVLEAEQDSLHLCLLGLKFRLQDLEQGLASWTLAHNRIVQLQALQAELQGAAERVDALLVFGEGLAERSEPRAWTSLEQVLRALGTHRDTIFQRLWQLQAQLISYSLDLLSLGLGHRKHLAAHHRRRLQKPQDKKRQGPPSLPDAMLEVDRGVPAPASRRPLTFLLLLLFLLLVGATLLLPLSGVPCCSHTRLARTPYLVLSYVNGLPPI
ncbi:nesprin-4 isoform X1 [Rattus norvegicus]|uniref:nesprin-4 isoform X1 n=1 Tax=Rattus norvegicus TaxID=10116 RepID=UPI0004E47F95|nr:nesprin-4 isoform X2 [Rattus norvegicus]|eukprot:XP_008757354.1 PREDICTED: nesprin-4 isoform X2 [Rattus norvegicus]